MVGRHAADESVMVNATGETLGVVCFGAHQDDNELQCLGTLLRLQAQRNIAVTLVTVTNGDQGMPYATDLTPSDVTRIRNSESAAVARKIGAEYVCLGEKDSQLSEDSDVRLRLTEIIRQASADLVFAPPPIDYSTDHTVTSRLVHQACLMATLPGVQTPTAPCRRTPALYYTDAVGGFGGTPTHFVDITAVWERKLEVLRLYESQGATMRDFAGADLMEMAEIVARYRGLQSGTRYAEGFSPALEWPRVHAEQYLP